MLAALMALTVILWSWAINSRPKPLEVIAFAVGKGDAFLIRSPSGRTVLIDAGSSDTPDVGTRLLVPNLLLMNVRKLDAIIISHPDSDHINGLSAIIDAMPVGMLLDPDLPDTESTTYQQLLFSARQRGVQHLRLRAGSSINLGETCRLNILSPGETLLSGTGSDDNNNSVVCKLEYGRSSMLFTGDLEAAGEQKLFETMPNLHADILKVAHHGSFNGTSDALLEEVRPGKALISCPGGERSGHPHPDLIKRLKENKVEILRTDVCGQIRLYTDGMNWNSERFKASK